MLPTIERDDMDDRLYYDCVSFMQGSCIFGLFIILIASSFGAFIYNNEIDVILFFTSVSIISILCLSCFVNGPCNICRSTSTTSIIASNDLPIESSNDSIESLDDLPTASITMTPYNNLPTAPITMTPYNNLPTAPITMTPYNNLPIASFV